MGESMVDGSRRDLAIQVVDDLLYAVTCASEYMIIITGNSSKRFLSFWFFRANKHDVDFYLSVVMNPRCHVKHPSDLLRGGYEVKLNSVCYVNNWNPSEKKSNGAEERVVTI